VPPPRSGHSLTYVGKNNYIMYGGIVDAVPGTGNKIQPTGDLYSMKITHSKSSFLWRAAPSCRVWSGASILTI